MKAERKPSSDIAQKLAMAAALGIMPSNLVGAFASVFLPDTLSTDDRRFLAGPVVVHQNGWTETLPTWLPRQAKAERVGIVLGTTPQFIVGPSEIASVMYPACLEAPLSHDMHELYLWATCTAQARKVGTDPAEVFGMIGMRPIADAEVVERNGRLFRSYSELAHDIRRKVIAAQAAREREARREERQAEREDAEAPEAEPDVIQHTLF